MQLDIQTLQKALETLDLSDSAKAALQDLLKDMQGEASIDLATFIKGLPMDLFAELQAIIEPQAGQESKPDRPPAELHGRMQDAENFRMHHMDMKSGKEGEDENKLMAGGQLAHSISLSETSPEDLERQMLEHRDDVLSSLKMLLKDGFVFPSIFGRAENDPFKFEMREIDASGNNQNDASIGQTGTAFMSVSGYAYGDGFSTPNDANRPNPRDISNEIFAQSGDVFNDLGTSNYLWVWGQFLDHDINLTREGHDEDYAIDVPVGDVHFDPFGTGMQTIGFTRSGFFDGSGDVADNPRLQVNDITAFVDASNVYGSTEEAANKLRAEGGKMLIGNDDLLPLFPGDRGMEFGAGDVRANENVGLTSMHTIFAREHNHWVDWIADQHPKYTDEKLYQAAKSIIEAQIQHVTYTEFLPKLLGENALSEYQGYDATIDPQIATEFSTAAFRVGHTMLSPDIFRMKENGSESDFGHLTLRNAFFRPDIILTQGGIDEILRGLASSSSQAIDASVIDDVRNFLFGPPGAGGFDLVSLIIQRGRDHGLPDFNTVREAYGLDPLADFSELTTDPVLLTKLTALYGDISHLDLWVGGLLEAPHGDGLVAKHSTRF